MVGHQTKCQDPVLEFLDSFLQEQIEFGPVFLGEENILAAVTPEDNMIDRPRKMDTWFACRSSLLPQECPNVKPDPKMTRKKYSTVLFRETLSDSAGLTGPNLAGEGDGRNSDNGPAQGERCLSRPGRFGHGYGIQFVLAIERPAWAANRCRGISAYMSEVNCLSWIHSP